jgi:methionyl aminopeptidase
MREVCRLAARTLVYIEKFIKPGVTTEELDQLVVDFTRTHGAEPAPLGYHGFPKSICTSINDVVCHGLPSATDILREGDIINVDVTPKLNGFYGDASATFFVGRVKPEVQHLVETAREARDIGIKAISSNAVTGDIGFAIEKYVLRRGYTTVREIGGHGIGRLFHDDPFVPSYGKKGKGERLRPYTCITVEPMVNQGRAEVVEFSIPGSQIRYYRTVDGQLSAQFEHTVLITPHGFEILTIPD